MKIIILVLFTSINFSLSAQIKTFSNVTKENDRELNSQYDSLSNTLPIYKIEQYIGQTFYLPKYNDSSIYTNNKLTQEMAGKYYYVIDIDKNGEPNGNTIYITLKEKETNTITHYKLNNSIFPFITEGYYIKQKNNYIDKYFILDMMEIWKYRVDDIDTKDAYIKDKYMIFNGTDYIIEEGDGWSETVILENINHSKIKMPKDVLNNLSNKTERRIGNIDNILDNERWKKTKQSKDELSQNSSFSEAQNIIGKTIYNYTEYVDIADSASSEYEQPKTIDKFIPLKVIKAEKINKSPAIKLYFEDKNQHKYSRNITFDKSCHSAEHFSTLFSTSNIRNLYPNISNSKWILIQKGKVCIGMTKDECKLSWGKPLSTNVTTTSSGSKEQWIYYASYLYFENGMLTVIQDKK